MNQIIKLDEESRGNASARTCGVPVELSMLFMYTFEEKKQEYTVYATVSDISVACANAIALVIKSVPTDHAYDTQGGVAVDGSLVSLDPSWYTRHAYTYKLKAIAKRFKTPYDRVVACDISFRIKRSRGNTYVKGKCLVFYAANNAKLGDEVAAWFDITATETATKKNTNDLESDRQVDQQIHTHTSNQMTSSHPRVPRTCMSCKKLDTREQKHRQCVCKDAVYCGRDCQRVHWRKQHKATCTHNKK
jgi:hypothetical protein